MLSDSAGEDGLGEASRSVISLATPTGSTATSVRCMRRRTEGWFPREGGVVRGEAERLSARCRSATTPGDRRGGILRGRVLTISGRR